MIKAIQLSLNEILEIAGKFLSYFLNFLNLILEVHDSEKGMPHFVKYFIARYKSHNTI